MHELLCPVQIGDGVREVVGQSLERTEWLVELVAVLGVLRRDLEGVARAADGLGREEHERGFEDLLPGRPSAAGRSDAVVRSSRRRRSA